MKYKTRETIADISAIVTRLVLFIFIVISISIAGHELANTWHDTRIICEQVTHAPKECR